MGGKSFDLKGEITPQKIFEWAKELKPVENQEEYQIALQVKQYNDKQGNIEGFYCDVCRNKGNVMVVNNNGEQVLVRCNCIKRRESIKNARISGMGELLQKSLDNFETPSKWQKGLLESVKKYIENPKNDWISMLGCSGAGKTHLCSAVANNFLEQGKRVIYMQWNSAIRELKLKATDGYSELIEKYKSADVLYIDDLFKGKITESDVNIAFEIINARAIKPDAITIISSELSIEQMAKVDEAIAGRIAQRCGDNVLFIKPDVSKNYRFRKVISQIKEKLS